MKIDNNSRVLVHRHQKLFSDDCRIAYRDLTGHSQNDTQQWPVSPFVHFSYLFLFYFLPSHLDEGKKIPSVFFYFHYLSLSLFSPVTDLAPS